QLRSWLLRRNLHRHVCEQLPSLQEGSVVGFQTTHPSDQHGHWSQETKKHQEDVLRLTAQYHRVRRLCTVQQHPRKHEQYAPYPSLLQFWGMLCAVVPCVRWQKLLETSRLRNC